jgi:hypothetical protein
MQPIIGLKIIQAAANTTDAKVKPTIKANKNAAMLTAKPSNAPTRGMNFIKAITGLNKRYHPST